MASHEYENMDVKFDAVLKSAAGKTLELGRGVFCEAERSVDFESDFVPLFSMGTRLQVIRIHGGAEVHRFEGEVYFSSPNRLRIISVQDEILPDAAFVFLYYVNLEGNAHAVVQKSRRHFLSRKTVDVSIDFPVKVHALSVHEIKFNTSLSIELEPEQPVTLSLMQGPAIQHLPVVVKQAIVFGQEANCYRCQIHGLTPESRRKLENYVHELSLAATQTNFIPD